MRKTVAVLALVALTLTGCAGPQMTLRVESKLTPEQHYVQTVREAILDADTVDARTLITVGVAACEASEAGVSDADIYAEGTDRGMTLREMKALFAAAEKYLCP